MLAGQLHSKTDTGKLREQGTCQKVHHGLRCQNRQSVTILEGESNGQVEQEKDLSPSA